MPYLIDGHNLIPKLPGLSLAEMDDEERLIQILLAFCRRQRKQAEVFFDNSPPGGVRARNFGLVVARFVQQGMTADEAIRRRLGRLGHTARNWTVISSDGEVRSAARAARAHYLSSDAFARLLISAMEDAGKGPREDEEIFLAPKEMEEWLQLFNSGEEKES